MRLFRKSGLGGIYFNMKDLNNVIEKIAKYYGIEDIEDELGFFLPDEAEEPVRKMTERQRSESFALRHPILTGIPTLGIWPGMAKAEAKNEVMRAIAKSHARAYDRYLDMRNARQLARAVEGVGAQLALSNLQNYDRK